MAVADQQLSEAQHQRLSAALRPRLTAYNAAEALSIKQQAALLLPHHEALYGGAAGGGKSSWGLHLAAQYVDIPGFSAVIIRRTYGMLSEAGGIMDRSKLWWSGTDATWHESAKRWTFPCPGGGVARVAFRHMDNVNDWMNFQGAEYQLVFFDELTQFTERQYLYLFSRLRKVKPPEAWEPNKWAKLSASQQRMVTLLSRVPVRMRAASNPGGPGHEWVKTRFGLYVPDGDPDPRRLFQRAEWINGIDESTGRPRNRVFVPAKVRDNPGLDINEYVAQLEHLDPVTRQQYLDGDWEAREPGEMFRREWFRVLDVAPKINRVVRYWDLAATEATPGTDPDWTAGVKMARREDGQGWVILDVQHFRRRSFEVEELVKQAAYIDSPRVEMGIEQEGGASGKTLISHYQRTVLPRFALRGIVSSGDKTTRARPVASKAEAGLISIVRAPWNSAFLSELESFPSSAHDDQVDALSGAFEMLEGRSRWGPAGNGR